MHSYDGRCAQLWRSVHTVGDSTDGHGRAALTAFSGLSVNAEPGVHLCGHPAVRAPSRASRPNETGDRRQCSPQAQPRVGRQLSEITKISRTVGMNDAVTKRPPALGPLARQLSRNVADTIGSAVPNPPLPNTSV